MKYHVTIEVAGVRIRIKNIKATNQDDAEAIALLRAKKSIKVVGSSVAPEEEPNAKPISGEDIFKKFFGR